MLTAIAADGTEARAQDEGRGRVILILHPGMDDGSTWRPVGSLLARRFRVVTPHRRTYRRDLPAGGGMDAELAHVRALVHEIDEPIVLVGHSSGAVVALEALVDMPEAFVGAVLYDPPLVTSDRPLGLPSTERRPGTYPRARAVAASGRPGRAFRLFAREVLRLPPPIAWLSGVVAALVPRLRDLVPAQIEDAAAINALGDRLDTYAGVPTRCVLLTGERGQGDLHERLAALADVLPAARRVSIPKQAHSAHRHAPAAVARVIENLADEVA